MSSIICLINSSSGTSPIKGEAVSFTIFNPLYRINKATNIETELSKYHKSGKKYWIKEAIRTMLVEIASFNESCLLALKATELIAFPNPLYIKAKINFKIIEVPKHSCNIFNSFMTIRVFFIGFFASKFKADQTNNTASKISHVI